MTDVTPSLTACQKLAEADAAYHSLLMGGGVRSVTDENGVTVTYSFSDPSRLLAYIARLIPLCPTYTPTSFAQPRPLRFMF